jgi:hypothetical protein
MIGVLRDLQKGQRDAREITTTPRNPKYIIVDGAERAA